MLNIFGVSYHDFFLLFLAFNPPIQLLIILLLKQKVISEFVCLFPKSSQTVNPNELKFLGMIPL